MTTVPMPLTDVARVHRSNWLERPWLALAGLCTLQILVWTAVPALTRSAFPRNAIEGYGWGREWLLISYKHPQLPAWCLELARLAYGSIGWPTYLLPQLFLAATYLIVYLIGSELLNRQVALAGTLLLAGCHFFTWPAVQFDHNVAQMPFWALVVWSLWRSVETDRIAWWLVLALASAVGMYAKLSTGLPLVFAAAWLVWDASARLRLRRPGPWIALATFLIMVGPLAVAIARSGFQPLHYLHAETASLDHAPWYFLLKEIGDNLPFLALLGIAAWNGGVRPVPGERRAGRRALVFLAIQGLGPLAFVTVWSLGGGVNPGWAAPMFNLTGLLSAAALHHWRGGINVRNLSIASFAFVVISAACVPLIQLGQRYLLTSPPVALWPERAIAARFETLWLEKTHRPLTVVGGNGWIAGIIAVPLAHAEIFTDFDSGQAPWINPGVVRKRGVLAVWQAGDAALQSAAAELCKRSIASGTESFAWSRGTAPPIAIRYCIVAPETRSPA